MSILYLVSMVLLYFSFLFYKKRDKKINIINHLVLNFVFLICYNLIVSYVLTALNIPITIITYTIITIGISAYFIYCEIKLKEMQKFYMRKYDLLAIILILVFGIVICLLNFRFEFSLAYETTDPSIHYMSAYAFALDDSLLCKPDTIYPVFGTLDSMTISYVNIGYLFKSFSSFLPSYELYKLFVLYDCFAYLLAICMFYVSINFFVKNKRRLLICLIVIFFFSSGYPLNNLLFGFRYLGDTIILINAIIYLMYYFQKNYSDANKKEKYILLISIMALNYGVFTGYYLFLPVVYGSIFFYFIYYFYKRKQLFKKEYFVVNIIVLLIPTILGALYFFTPLLKSNIFLNDVSGGSDGGILNLLSMEGYIYRDLYSNFVILLPFFLFYYIRNVKKRQFDFVFIIANVLILFILCLFILGMLGKASSYYYFKNYFMLWPIMFYILFVSLDEILANDANYLYINTVLVSILVLFGITFFDLDFKIANRNGLYNVDFKAVKYFDIYATNRVYMRHPSKLDNNDLEALTYFNENIRDERDDYNIVPVIGDTQQRLWAFTLIHEFPNKIKNETFAPFYDSSFTLKEAIENRKYEIIIGLNKLSSDDKQMLKTEGYIVVFENSDSFVIRTEAN